jgi:hypothetical protein
MNKQEGTQEHGAVAAPPAEGGLAGAPCSGVGRVRLAVGVFRRAANAAEALHDLACVGITRGDVSLVANEAALAEAEAALVTRRRGPVQSIARLIRCRSIAAAYPSIFELIEDSGCGSSPPLACEQALALDRQHWALTKPAEELHHGLRVNGGVLIVRLADDRQQQAVCSILLRHSASGVQTHDVRHPEGRSWQL